jgi:hypothetical protein
MNDTTPTKQTRVGTAGGNAIGIGVGNSIAYFLIWYGERYHEIVFDDPLLAMAMGGALVSGLLLELKLLVGGLKYVFDRIFPDHKH